eukprot:456594-Hanusia_phi.AAC.1
MSGPTGKSGPGKYSCWDQQLSGPGVSPRPDLVSCHRLTYYTVTVGTWRPCSGKHLVVTTPLSEPY